MYPPIRRRRNRIIHMQIPKLGLPRRIVRREQFLEAPQRIDLFAAQAEPSRDGGDVAAAMY